MVKITVKFLFFIYRMMRDTKNCLLDWGWHRCIKISFICRRVFAAQVFRANVLQFGQVRVEIFFARVKASNHGGIHVIWDLNLAQDGHHVASQTFIIWAQLFVVGRGRGDHGSTWGSSVLRLLRKKNLSGSLDRKKKLGLTLSGPMVAAKSYMPVLAASVVSKDCIWLSNKFESLLLIRLENPVEYLPLLFVDETTATALLVEVPGLLLLTDDKGMVPVGSNPLDLFLVAIGHPDALKQRSYQ